MQPRWTKFPSFRESARRRTESRPQHLAPSHGDLAAGAAPDTEHVKAGPAEITDVELPSFEA